MSKNGFTFAQIATILLVMLVLMALILLFITQRDQIGAMLQRMLGIGNASLTEAQDQLKDQLGIDTTTQLAAPNTILPQPLLMPV